MEKFSVKNLNVTYNGKKGKRFMLLTTYPLNCPPVTVWASSENLVPENQR